MTPRGRDGDRSQLDDVAGEYFRELAVDLMCDWGERRQQINKQSSPLGYPSVAQVNTVHVMVPLLFPRAVTLNPLFLVHSLHKKLQ